MKNYCLDCRPPMVFADTVLLCTDYIFHFIILNGSPRPTDSNSATTAALYTDLLTREMQLPIYDVQKEYLYTTILVRKRFV